MKLPAGVSKEKFDAVIRNLLNTPPLPLAVISPKTPKEPPKRNSGKR